MIYAPITSFLPLPSPAYRGHGHARAKNILAKCDSRVSLSSSTDVVEAIKSEPEAASRGLKRTALSILLIDPDSLLHPKKKERERFIIRRKGMFEESRKRPYSALIILSSSSCLVWCFGEVYSEREVNQSAQHILPFMLVPLWSHFLRANRPQLLTQSPLSSFPPTPDCNDRFDMTRVP